MGLLRRREVGKYLEEFNLAGVMEGNLFPQFPTTESGPAEPTVDAEEFRAM